MAVTFLTTEDAQAINTQLSNLVETIAELNRQIQQSNQTILYFEGKFNDAIDRLERLIIHNKVKTKKK